MDKIGVEFEGDGGVWYFVSRLPDWANDWMVWEPCGLDACTCVEPTQKERDEHVRREVSWD